MRAPTQNVSRRRYLPSRASKSDGSVLDVSAVKITLARAKKLDGRI
jgi:hypothetical protein